MNRIESDKEDLIRDATAMVDRAEYSMVSIDNQPSIVTAGFRKDDSLSLYFDQDPFYQFDAGGLLRRAFESGYLYRSQGVTLAQLNRTRTSQQTALNRHELDSSELLQFRIRMTAHLKGFLQQLQAGTADRLRSVTNKSNFDSILGNIVADILDIDTPFLSTAITKRK